MGVVKSCCREQKDSVLLVAKMDFSHCGCVEVPNVVFNAERCIETLILASNQICSLPPQLFHCQELKYLNLIDNCITTIPPAIGSLVHLVSLKLDKNNLKDLPENLKCCRKLRRLSLNNNKWRQMPSIVTQLISLEEMFLNDCELSFLPASVGRLTKLKILELRNNNLCNLPLSMARLTSLTRLDIGDNEFIEFPACINSLKSLIELLIDNNDIEEITDVKNLVNLEHLDGSYNHITSISDTIGYCSNLTMLNLSFNYLEQLPESIGNIEKLETLHLEMNELTELPKTIGKLKNLEDLNICNNRLCNIPISIGLLRNLRNLNLSRNLIEEFPSEIGSCTKLSVVNAGYNRLQVLPSEIGYLNNLKVLDLVGNFLMYLPITIINLRCIRAIWLSSNQNVPLIPFTEDLNTANGERFLTNIALPQLGEIPFFSQSNSENKTAVAEKSSSWNKKIRFAEDDDILPGKLHRIPTPFPKELRSPNRKQHKRNDELKNNDNYVNLIEAQAYEQELHPPTMPVTKNGVGLLNFTESCVTMIREANIRRNHKEVNPEVNLKEKNWNISKNNSEFTKESDNDIIAALDSTLVNSNIFKSDAKIVHNEESQFGKNLSAPKEIIEDLPLSNDNVRYQDMECDPSDKFVDDCSNRERLNFQNCQQFKTNGEKLEHDKNADHLNGEKIIYSNINNTVNDKNCKQMNLSQFEFDKTDAQAIRQMYHNDLISGRGYNSKSHDEISDVPPKVPFESRTQTSPNNLNLQGMVNADKKLSQTNLHNLNNGHYKKFTSSQISRNEAEKPLSKQELIVLTEKMRSKNISPPCYEIAKMYSTKAALFENNRMENCQ